MCVCIFAQVGPDVVKSLSPDVLFQFGRVAFRVRVESANHLVDVGLRKFEFTLNGLEARQYFIQYFLESLIAERFDEITNRTQPQCILPVVEDGGYPLHPEHWGEFVVGSHYYTVNLHNYSFQHLPAHLFLTKFTMNEFSSLRLDSAVRHNLLNERKSKTWPFP